MKRIFVYTAGVFIFFLIGVLLANFVIMPAFVRLGEELVVPDVCNLPVDTAIEILQEHKLRGVVTERRNDLIIAEGNVIIQEPLPGARVKKGRIINLTVSLGQEMLNVPFLLGVDFKKGRSIIEKLGLAVESVDSVFSDSIPFGKIIKTIPAFETEVKKGESIKIIVSKGIMLKMPNLGGINLDQAKEILKRMQLNIREITEVEGSGTKGSIVLQDPEPGQIVNAGDSVNLMVIK